MTISLRPVFCGLLWDGSKWGGHACLPPHNLYFFLIYKDLFYIFFNEGGDISPTWQVLQVEAGYNGAVRL